MQWTCLCRRQTHASRTPGDDGDPKQPSSPSSSSQPHTHAHSLRYERCWRRRPLPSRRSAPHSLVPEREAHAAHQAPPPRYPISRRVWGELCSACWLAGCLCVGEFPTTFARHAAEGWTREQAARRRCRYHRRGWGGRCMGVQRVAMYRPSNAADAGRWTRGCVVCRVSSRLSSPRRGRRGRSRCQAQRRPPAPSAGSA